MRDLLRRSGGWIALLAALGGGYFLFHRVLLAPEPIEVRVTKVERGTVERIVANTRAGSIRARLRTQVSADRAARVVEIFHREGARVEAQEPLVQLDDRDARAALRVAEEDLEHARGLQQRAGVVAADARREYERFLELRRKETVSQADLDRATTSHELAQAAQRVAASVTEQSQARLEQATLEVRKMVIRAPFAGILTEVYREVGEWAVPGGSIVEMIDPDALYVRAELDEIDTGELEIGLPTRIRLDPFPGRLFQGRITRVAPFVSETRDQDRTVEVEVVFDPEISELGLKAGMSADVDVILERTAPETRRVSTLAILEGNRVLVVRDGRAVEIEIETGLSNWEFTEVTGGLEEGAEVIVSLDREEVREGALVQVEDEPER